MKTSIPSIATFLADDGYPFHLRRWDVENAVGDVVILHGIISHSGWYETTGSQLASSGFNVHSLDRRGSGLNLIDRGDVSNCQRWIDDVVQYVHSIRSSQTSDQIGVRPVFLVGISWGGLLATAVAKQISSQIDGLILLCPGFFSRKGTSQTQHNAVKLASGIGLGGLRFPVPLRDPELFTRSSKWRTYIAEDPFTLRKVTLRLATASAALYHDTIKTPTKVETSTLLMLGGQDLIIHNDQVRNFVNKYFGDQPTIHVYPAAAHTLEFEDDMSTYLADLTQWCINRANSRSIA